MTASKGCAILRHDASVLTSAAPCETRAKTDAEPSGGDVMILIARMIPRALVIRRVLAIPRILSPRMLLPRILLALVTAVCAGVAGGTYIFCVPGSPGACKDAWDGILKWQLDNRHRPCNFVEIMPRLQEHKVAG